MNIIYFIISVFSCAVFSFSLSWAMVSENHNLFKYVTVPSALILVVSVMLAGAS